MLSYLPDVVGASRVAVSPLAGTPAGPLVVRADDLRFHGGVTVTAGDSAPSAGELAVFCRPVVTAPAVVRRDGSVLAGGWLPDFVRLGELERHLGDGVIEEITAAALEQGRLRQRQRRRIMSYPLVIRLMLAMTLMPDGSYGEALARLAGLLADVPFALDWHVPTGKVITGWRALVPASLMEALFWRATGPLIAGDDPQAVLLAGMMVCAADGMLVAVADTPANRAMFGCAGTATQDGPGSAPFPQLRVVALTARAGRAVLGAIAGSTRAGEQTLLARLARRRPSLFAGRVTCFDRNFPGYDLISAILAAGGHVVARVKAGISLPAEPGGGWLPDGSRMTWLNAPSGKTAGRLPVRAAEHNVILPCGGGDEAGETCTLVTTLLDHQAAPAGAVREAYLARWSASETTFGEDKTTITGAGHRTSGPVLRSGSPRLVIQGSLGLAGRHPARARQRRRRAAQRGRRSPHPAPQAGHSGHPGRGILHRRLAPRDPLHDLFPGHHVIVAGRHRRRGGRRSTRRAAHPERHRPPAPLTARPESPPEIRAHLRDETDRHRETPGHRVRARHRVTPRPGRNPPGRSNRPGTGAADRGTARHPRRDTRAKTTPAPRTAQPGNGLQDPHGTRKPQHPGTRQTPKVPGVASCVPR